MIVLQIFEGEVNNLNFEHLSLRPVDLKKELTLKALHYNTILPMNPLCDPILIIY